MCIVEVLQHTQAPKLLRQSLEVGVGDRDPRLRARCMEYTTIMLQCWSTPAIEKSIAAVDDAIRKGMTDANSDARSAARRSFWVSLTITAGDLGCILPRVPAMSLRTGDQAALAGAGAEDPLGGRPVNAAAAAQVRRQDIAGVWVAFFQECQQYRCGQGGVRAAHPHAQSLQQAEALEHALPRPIAGQLADIAAARGAAVAAGSAAACGG